MLLSRFKFQIHGSLIQIKSSLNKIPHSAYFLRLKKVEILTLRKFHNIDGFDKDDEEESTFMDFTKFKELNKTDLSSRLEKLSSLLKCSIDESGAILRANPTIDNESGMQISNRIAQLQEKDFTLDAIRNNPWLLTYDLNILDAKIQLVKMYTKLEVSKIVPLLAFPYEKLQKFLIPSKSKTNFGGKNERIVFLSETLECSEMEVCELIQKYNFILTVPFWRVHCIITMLREYGVEPKAICRDMWVLRHKPEVVRSRLEEARLAGIKVLRPWMIRCPLKVLNRTIECHIEQKKALGSDGSITEYLARRLKLDKPSDGYTLAKTHPPILRAKPLNLESTLDALSREGITNNQIIKFPRVLCHSADTVLSRLKYLRETFNHEPRSLSVVCRSQRQFNEYVVKYLKRKNDQSAH